MLNAIGVERCTTTHGGSVMARQKTKTHHGLPMLQKGDGFFCPKCKLWSCLIEGNSILSFDGIRASIEGDRFTCGAKLIAKQTTAKTSLEGNAKETQKQDFSITSKKDTSHKVPAQFQAIDKNTNEILANREYFLQLGNGEKIYGKTNQEGLTEVVYVEESEKITVHFYFRTPVGEIIQLEDIINE